LNNKPPTVILIAGLQGSGKTTFTGKLAKYLKSKGKNPLLGGLRRVSPRRYRPIDRALAEQVEVEVYKEITNKDAVQIALKRLWTLPKKRQGRGHCGHRRAFGR
jgi:signal recognition particle subunit SRP54